MDPARILEGLDPEQRAAVTDDAARLVVLAGPGAGKTRVLTGLVAHRAAVGRVTPERALVVTFSRRAAGELRARLGAAGLGRVRATTFHGVAWHLLRRWLLDHGRRPPVLREDPLSPEEARRRGVLSLDHLIPEATELLHTDPSWAEAVRWRFPHLFVDEFQDVTPAQRRFVDALAGSEGEICLVGDPDQAIYGWNGADPEAIGRFVAERPDATVRSLSTNHRSAPSIVEAGMAVLGAARRGPEAAARHDSDSPGSVERVDFHDPSDEARGIAHRLCRWVGGGAEVSSWSDVAVLARTNSQLRTIADALTAAGVPTRRLDPHETAEPGGAVTLGTLHASKGLEWPVVVLAGLTQRWMPLARPSDHAAVAEERRLLYVGVTRARTRLLLTTFANDGDGAVAATPWIDALSTASPRGAARHDESASLGVGAGWRAELARARRCLGSDDPARHARRRREQRLDTWRRRAARAALVQPQAVLTDRELRRLAAGEYRSVADLAGAGIGAARLARIGSSLISALNDPVDQPVGG